LPALMFLALGYALLVFQAARRSMPKGSAASQYRLGWVICQVSLILALCTVDVWESAMSYVFFLFGCGACFASANVQPVANAATVQPENRRNTLSFTRFPRQKSATEMDGMMESE
jgi:hypothetical protein